MTDFSVYQPPGVYVEESTRPLVGRVSASTALTAIVGPSIDYRTLTETITLPATTAVDLSQKGVKADTIVVRTLGGAVLVLGDDYVVTDDDAADERDLVVSIARNPTGDIDSGQAVRVSYRYVGRDFYEPLVVRSVDEAEAAFGAAFGPDGSVQSPLALAAKVAMDNGSGPLMLVSTVGASTQATLEAAMTKLEAYDDVSIVVPLPVGIGGTEQSPGSTVTTAQALQSHVESMSAQGSYRIGIYGSDAENTVDPRSVAAGASSPRVMVAHPNRMLYVNPSNGESVIVGAQYLAAAYAGRFSGQAAQLPVTRKVIRGFSGISADGALRVDQRNALSANGVAVAEVNVQRQLVCRHGVSTSLGSFADREISVTRARDTMMRVIQETVESAGLIGQVLSEETPSRVRSVVEGALESLQARGLFIDYRDLSSRQSQSNPTVIEVKFQYRPSYPVNYIVVAFSIDADTGQTSLIAA